MSKVQSNMSSTKLNTGLPQSTNDVQRESCWICGESSEHKPWCENMARKVYDRFNSTFREIYNIIELSLPTERAEIAKDLAGNKIMETRNDCIEIIRRFHLTDEEWRDLLPASSQRRAKMGHTCGSNSLAARKDFLERRQKF